MTQSANRRILGIDIGGSGIKGSLVDLETGSFASPRHRIPTPVPSTPEAVTRTVGAIARHFEYEGPLGCTLPSVIRAGCALTAANIDRSWVGVDAGKILRDETGCNVTLINDADAAGIAEMRYGAGQGAQGVVIVFTLGTGIGSAVFTDGRLVPNTEFGHLQIDGQSAEISAAAKVRTKEGLSWAEWAARVDRYLGEIERLFWPDLLILGGGVSNKHQKFLPFLSTRAPVVPARLQNAAGIIGAAWLASRLDETRREG